MGGCGGGEESAEWRECGREVPERRTNSGKAGSQTLCSNIENGEGVENASILSS